MRKTKRPFHISIESTAVVLLFSSCVSFQESENLNNPSSAEESFEEPSESPPLSNHSSPNPILDSDPVSGSNKILMFVPYNRVWWAEYKVLYEGLKASGYEVAVTSSGTGVAQTYQTDQSLEPIHTGYSAFTSQFNQYFSTPWISSWNTNNTGGGTGPDIPLDGRIQDIDTMSDYIALVIAGGDGALLYRFDGNYGESIGVNNHTSSAQEVQAASEKLSSLMVNALENGKPVLSQCHGGTLPAFAKIPGTNTSVLNGRIATGFYNIYSGEPPSNPNNETASAFSSLGAVYRYNDPVVISSVSSSWSASIIQNPHSKVITSRDWLPQTIAQATRALVTLLQTTPQKSVAQKSIKTLIIHAGAADVPHNYTGTQGSVAPATHQTLMSLLTASSNSDGYTFDTDAFDLSSRVDPRNPPNTLSLNNQGSLLSLFQEYDSLLFFVHWSNEVTSELQNAMIQFAEAGGGVISLHHGLYNGDTTYAPNPARNKDRLIEELFRAQSTIDQWSGRSPYPAAGSPFLNPVNNFAAPPSGGRFAMINANLGHFITTHLVTYENSPMNLPVGLPAQVNGSTVNFPTSSSGRYPYLAISDELYNNFQFLSSVTAESFGRGVGKIEILFANNHTSSINQVYTTGFVRRYNPTGGPTEGRIVYLSPGEIPTNLVSSHPYGQIIRNAVVWAAQAE
jgi:putative intracellular protease/amidase